MIQSRPAGSSSRERETTTPAQILEVLHQRGVRLFLDNGRLRYQTAKGALPPDLKVLLLHHKAELLAWLQAPVLPQGLEGSILQRNPPRDDGGSPPEGLNPPGVRPFWMRLDGSCFACRGRRAWRSVHGTVTCATCHPPASGFLPG